MLICNDRRIYPFGIMDLGSVPALSEKTLEKALHMEIKCTQY